MDLGLHKKLLFHDPDRGRGRRRLGAAEGGHVGLQRGGAVAWAAGGLGPSLNGEGPW